MVDSGVVTILQIQNWNMTCDTPHVFLLTASFACGFMALILYFRITAKLESIGEETPGLFETKKIFKTLQKYRNIATENAWPSWLPYGYWLALVWAAIFGFVWVYWR